MKYNKIFEIKTTLILLMTFININGVYSQSKVDYLDCNMITYSQKRNIEIDSISIIWGNQVIKDLQLHGLTNTEKAERINDFIHKEFKYNSKRRREISEIIEKKDGFCISHALISIFLLRLADVPAKFAHEVHIIKRKTIMSLIIGRYAKKNNDGINSYWHNDHVWVWFKTKKGWLPFDSALGICGFEDFFNKRYLKHKELRHGIIEKWTGPPFVIWEENSLGLDSMKNVSSKVWENEAFDKNAVLRSEWMELVKIFESWESERFYKAYLDEQRLEKVRNVSIGWFKAN